MTKDHVKLENSKKSNVQFFFEMVPQLKRVKKWSLKNISDKYFETKQFGTKMMIISKYGSDMPQKLHILFQLHFSIHLTPFGWLKSMFLQGLFQGGSAYDDPPVKYQNWLFKRKYYIFFQFYMNHFSNYINNINILKSFFII